MSLKITVYDTDYYTGERVGDPIRILTPKAIAFAYDGCHKCYLLRNEGELARAIERGFNQADGSILPISELPRIWGETCGLRFISSADLTTPYVEQCEAADVIWEQS